MHHLTYGKKGAAHQQKVTKESCPTAFASPLCFLLKTHSSYSCSNLNICILKTQNSIQEVEEEEEKRRKRAK